MNAKRNVFAFLPTELAQALDRLIVASDEFTEASRSFNAYNEMFYQSYQMDEAIGWREKKAEREVEMERTKRKARVTEAMVYFHKASGDAATAWKAILSAANESDASSI